MSIDTTPPGGGHALPGDQCVICYPPGETPQFMWMCFSGIKRGDLFGGFDPTPPNGPHIVGAIQPCKWIGTDSGFDFYYQEFPPRTHARSHFVGRVNAFYQLALPSCELWFSNIQQNPVTEHYYGGWCMVVPPLAGGWWSIPELLELVSNDPEWAQWLNPHPDVDRAVFYNLYDRYNRVNVKIKIVHP